jgi:hypothetical protein
LCVEKKICFVLFLKIKKKKKIFFLLEKHNNNNNCIIKIKEKKRKMSKKKDEKKDEKTTKPISFAERRRMVLTELGEKEEDRLPKRNDPLNEREQHWMNDFDERLDRFSKDIASKQEIATKKQQQQQNKREIQIYSNNNNNKNVPQFNFSRRFICPKLLADVPLYENQSDLIPKELYLEFVKQRNLYNKITSFLNLLRREFEMNKDLKKALIWFKHQLHSHNTKIYEQTPGDGFLCLTFTFMSMSENDQVSSEFDWNQKLVFDANSILSIIRDTFRLQLILVCADEFKNNTKFYELFPKKTFINNAAAALENNEANKMNFKLYTFFYSLS